MQGCSEFVFSIKIQSTQISHAKRQIFNKIPNFVKVAPLSTEQLFFLAEVVLSRTPQSPTQKYTSKHFLQNSSRWLLSDDEEEGIEYKVKRINYSEW